jgi:hypothetical protein
MELREIEQSQNGPLGIHQVHPAQRTISRRRLFSAAVGAGGFALTSGLWRLSRVSADEGNCDEEKCFSPLPIPHITSPPGAHFFFPGPVTGDAVPPDPTGAHPGGRDPSLITNFKGFIGEADVNFSGTGTNTRTGASATFKFTADIRFMKGMFVESDEHRHHGAFAFI